MKTYLVTGGAGFIGSNFIHYMFKKNPDIRLINVDKLTYSGNLDNLFEVSNRSNYVFHPLNICDREQITRIFETYDIDYVVNFAAESHVDRSIEEPDIFIRTNVLGTQVLLDVAKQHWLIYDQFRDGKKFIQVSTDEVYGSIVDGYFTENTPIAPRSPYSASKAGADLIVQAYFETYGMPVNITRCSNNYGPYQYTEKLIPLLINNCLQGHQLPIYGTGKNIRDWIFVDDHCEAIDLVVQKGKNGEIYNIGSNNEKENIEIAKLIIAILQEELIDDNRATQISDNLITYVTDRKGHDWRYAIDSSKIRNELGWSPNTEFADGIRKTVRWYLNNEQWLNNVLKRRC